ncbi:hypothetical protein [Streptomyces sp. SD15]
MAKTKVWRGSVHKEMSPKTLKNLHGLLSSILREAMQEEPPLRARNPCELVRLPRTDDDGVDDDGDDEDMSFLLPRARQRPTSLDSPCTAAPPQAAGTAQRRAGLWGGSTSAAIFGRRRHPVWRTTRYRSCDGLRRV